MRNLTPFEKLKAITLGDPAPYSPGSEHCALARAARAVSAPNMTTEDLEAVGQALGFGIPEVMGIVDGWDATDHGGLVTLPFFANARMGVPGTPAREEANEGYAAGYEYGAELRRAVQARDRHGEVVL